ncbi:MAG: hypothetical protein M1835_006210 [Candelina submexicana]|nr:MAG: hypothetical protein M1835_006210 [Candelina submexicana]
MPSPFTSSFASAAAGNANQDGNSQGRTQVRGENSGSGDWSRARTNGATQTFRRPSLATNLSHSSQHQREGSLNQGPTGGSNSGVYLPPHLNLNYQTISSRSGNAVDNRYSREQLLDLYKSQSESGDLSRNLSNLFVGGWEPKNVGGVNGGSWGRKDESAREAAPGPDVCWDHDGSVQPLALFDMTEEDRELFSTSVNSPLKAPQNANKDNAQNNGGVARKMSISQAQNTPGSFGVSSPTSSRPGNRRRDTSESISFASNPLASPIGNSRFFRDENTAATPPPSLLRRRTDMHGNVGLNRGDKDTQERDRDNPLGTSAAFGALKRNVSGPFSAGVNGPSSPWSTTPQSAGFAAMGAFGNFNLGGTTTQPPSAVDKKPGFGSVRGESRFKDLMTRDSTEDLESSLKEKNSTASLERLSETEPDRPQQRWVDRRTTQPLSIDTDSCRNDEGQVGSAALGGGQDSSPPRQRIADLGTSARQAPREELGLSAFGMSSDLPSFRDTVHQHQRRDLMHNLAPQGGVESTPGRNEPMSPTNTNPYQSPEGEKASIEDIDTDGSDIPNAHLPGLVPLATEQAIGTFGHLSRGVSSAYEGTASDRSQTSSAGPGRGFPPLGLGTLNRPVWPAEQGLTGTPSREKPPFTGVFGDSIFGPLGDLQSPTFGGLPAGDLFGPAAGSRAGATGTLGRGSKMGSLFPTAMQEQMRGGDFSRQNEASIESLETQNSGHARTMFGSNAPVTGNLTRGTDSPLRTSRGMFDNLFGDLEGNRAVRGSEASFGSSDATAIALNQTFSSAALQTPLSATSTVTGLGQPDYQQQRHISQGGSMHSHTSGTGLANQPLATQQRTMVMPDRMRWIYRDPHGNPQGPWSGLEMHDWFKAGFFNQELLVKKFEDPEYETLAQLIRRIGNAREPFLVPQPGISHGSSSGQSTTPWAVPNAPPSSGGPAVGAAQPPFASSFPSFGTTLTAEQQNALERRKQEEQYLMARQKEHLAQQQVILKQMHQMQGGQHPIHPQQLHHNSSAHSLQSQPSFGSIASPNGYQPSPTQGPNQTPQGLPGFFDASVRPGAGVGPGPMPSGSEPLGGVREDDLPGFMERRILPRGSQFPLGSGSGHFGQQHQDNSSHVQQVAAMMNDRGRLHREQAQYDEMQQALPTEQQTSDDRLQQFQDLRSRDDDVYAEGVHGQLIGPQSGQNERQQHEHQQQPPYRALLPVEDLMARTQLSSPTESSGMYKDPEVLSLAEQVQKAASAKQSPAPVPQSAWAKIETGLPQPFPPPPLSASPLPAPAAQRSRHNVADTLTAESRSRSQTPSAETPSASIAPWAKEINEASKGPSLKEIQQAEARKAAQQEEIAAATRRAAQELERSNQPSAPAPGLPSSSTWGSGSTPTTPATAIPSAWVKPLAGKIPVPQSGGGAKKTLQQIQKEEESRKQKAAAAASATIAASAVAGVSQAGITAGKRYADLASKNAPPQAPGGTWTTVGSSGKIKPPAGPTIAGPLPGLRVASGSAVPTIAAPPKPRSVTNAPRSSAVGGSLTGQPNANEEFTKWAKGALAKGLNSSINVDNFVQDLLSFPPDAEIISESVYANSPTLDGRRFAEEFIRRRKLADKGLVDPSTHASTGFSPVGNTENRTSGGWSEVAKKGPVNGAKEEPSSAFKVVAPKKKGKK